MIFGDQNISIFIIANTSVWSSRPQRYLREMTMSARILVVAEGTALRCHSVNSADWHNFVNLAILDDVDGRMLGFFRSVKIE